MEIAHEHRKRISVIMVAGVATPIVGTLLYLLLPNGLIARSLSVSGSEMGFRTLYHVALHSITLLLGAFVTFTAITAYSRTRRGRLLAVSTAFSLLIFRELVIMSGILFFGGEIILLNLGVELSHLMDLSIISLFFSAAIIGSMRS